MDNPNDAPILFYSSALFDNLIFKVFVYIYKNCVCQIKQKTIKKVSALFGKHRKMCTN